MLELLIDGEKIDFKLESEKSLSEVIDSIELYLNNYRRHISKVLTDGDMEIDIDDKEKLKEYPIENIQHLKVFSNTATGSSIETLVDIKNYAEKYLYYIQENIENLSEEKSEEIEGLNWIVNGTLGAVYTLGITAESVYHKGVYLGDILKSITDVINKLNQNRKEPEKFNDILKNETKPLLKEFHDFINVLGLKIYFNMMYPQSVANKEIDRYKTKSIAFFKSYLDSIPYLKKDFSELKADITKGVDKDKLMERGRKLINVTSNSANDIIQVYGIFELDPNEIKIGYITPPNKDKIKINAVAYSKLILDILSKMETDLVNNKFDNIAKIVDEKIEGTQLLNESNEKNLFENISDILNNIIKNLEKSS
ncbi:MAG: hypothetical protein ACOCV8_02335 [Spirochaetota bacterium]